MKAYFNPNFPMWALLLASASYQRCIQLATYQHKLNDDNANQAASLVLGWFVK